MDKLIPALIIVIITFYISACSPPVFHSSQEKTSAKISFSSMSTNRAELSISLRGKSYAISNDMFERRKPASPTNKVFNIPADEEIILDYNILEISVITYTPIIKGSVNPSLGYTNDFEEHHTLNTCSKKIAFSTEKNKVYEVFVERTEGGEICQIYVKEVMVSLKNTHKTFKHVKTKTLVD